VSDRTDPPVPGPDAPVPEPGAPVPEPVEGSVSDPGVPVPEPVEGSGTTPSTATTAVEPPSSDVAVADEASPLPGVHRGGFSRLPTAPVALTIESAPAEPGTDGRQEPLVQWLVPAPPPPRRGLAGWALAFSIGGLVFSLFVGWGFPIGLVGIVTAILALRRPLESRAVAVWALVLGIVSVLFSAGWMLYAASRANLFG